MGAGGRAHPFGMTPTFREYDIPRGRRGMSDTSVLSDTCLTKSSDMCPAVSYDFVSNVSDDFVRHMSHRGVNTSL